jgi:hypothetical protein
MPPVPNPTPTLTPAPATPPAPGFSWNGLFAGILYGFIAALILTGIGAGVWWWEHTKPNPAPDITVPAAVKALPGRIIEVKVETKATEIQWNLASAAGDWDMIDAWGGKRMFFVSPTAGEYKFLVVAIVGGHLTPAQPCTITVGTPTPPVPPKPPEPPTPPAPIPVAGLRMLVVYKLVDMGKLPAAQRDILYSTTIRDYMRQHGAKAADGTAESRFWDESEDVSKESQLWQDAFKRPRKSLPWLIISDGKTGYEGPLPGSTDEMMGLLQKYGG